MLIVLLGVFEVFIFASLICNYVFLLSARRGYIHETKRRVISRDWTCDPDIIALLWRLILVLSFKN